MRTTPPRAAVAPVTGLILLGLVASILVVAGGRRAEAATTTVAAATFEDGTAEGWVSHGGTTLTNSAVARSGGRGLQVSGRTTTWHGAEYDLLPKLVRDNQYALSVWVRLANGEAPTRLRLTVERRWQGQPTYETVSGNVTVSADGWTQLAGLYTLAYEVDYLVLYVEADTSAGAAFHLDDFLLTYTPPGPVQTALPALKDAFSFPIGAMIGRPETANEHATLLARHFSSLTPDNALKWEFTEPTEGVFRYADADALVAFAEAHGMTVKGHTLVWHEQLPSWVFLGAEGAPMTPTAANKTLLLNRLSNHIRAVMGRYQGKISAWDVVNEVIDPGQVDGLRRSPWYTIAGLDFIRTAFRTAREVDPAAKLYINEYDSTSPSKRDKLLALVTQLRQEGVPVDGVGHQVHANVALPSAADMDAALTRFAQLGVRQQVTELDVSVYTNDSSSYDSIPADLLAQQATRYKALFDVFRAHRADLDAVIICGLADDRTWLRFFPITRLDAPLLFDAHLQAKPAYYAIMGTPTTAPTSAPPATCRVRYRVVGQWNGGFQGEVTLSNTGTLVLNGWSLEWTFANGQKISQLWNGRYTQPAATVTVANLPWNAAIAPAGSVAIGFLANWQGTNAVPTAFTVNGRACAG